MFRRLLSLCPLLLCSVVTTPSAGTAHGAVLTLDLQQRLQGLRPGEDIRVIAHLREQVDLSLFPLGRESAPEMIRALQETAARSQTRVLSFLHSNPSAHDIRGFWITNCVAFAATEAVIGGLSGLSEVERIEFDEPLVFPRGDFRPSPAPSPASKDGGRNVYWNLEMVRVDEVWDTYGLDGTGIVVGSMDTGADINHPALQGKWRGGDNSWIDIQNGLPEPYDDHGHGTHTIGTMVGGDGRGPFSEDIGVAYNAKFIAAKVLDANNAFNDASIVIAGAQWMLDPDGDPGTSDFPHVINNSWYFFNQFYTGFYSTAAAWRAAGIVPVFCIGNEGPAASTTRPPANYSNVLGVGATDAGDAIAAFSSRGPSPAGQYYPPDRRKPDLSAPGVTVRSSVPGGGYQAWSGTSMAAPHVAGTAALMLQGNQELTYDEIWTTVTAAAVDRGAVGYDHDYGYGRLDSFEAVTRALADAPEIALEAGMALHAAPNPFGDRVSLRLSSGGIAARAATLRIVDARGRVVRTQRFDGDAGWVATWDGRDSRGDRVAAGVYFVKLSTGGSEISRRVTLLR